MSRMLGPQNRLSVIDNLEKKHRLTRIVTDNLCHYMDTVRREREGQRDDGERVKARTISL